MKKALIRNYLNVLRVGCAAALLVTMAGIFAWCAILLYCNIPSAIGYCAVADFFVATFSICCAVLTIYTCGLWIMKRCVSK